MKKLKMKLEYRCFPIWIYDENNDLITNDLPDILINDLEIDPLCVKLQEEFDALYLDSNIEFKYGGFENEDIKVQFVSSINNIESILHKKVGSDYEIINEISMHNL